MPSRPLPSRDFELIQIVDAALADATRRSGAWLACRLGCTQCCVGAFPISQLDALRLQHGLTQLERHSAERAQKIRSRSQDAVRRLSGDFPGDPATGLLDESEPGQKLFADFANDEPCPVLDPTTGACELYEFRPMTCRVFGPPVRSEDGLGSCELCFQGATDEQIVACEMTPDPAGLEEVLNQQLEKDSNLSGSTIVAFCLGK